jgi:hypothetical protein
MLNTKIRRAGRNGIKYKEKHRQGKKLKNEQKIKRGRNATKETATK